MKHATKLLTIAGASLIGANVASAGFSTIGPSLNPAEPTQADILGTVLGGTFTANGLNFTNGSITATRVDDSLDKFWSGGSLNEVSSNTSLTHTVTLTDNKYVLARPGATFTSDPADNVDGKDHMITYVLSGTTSGYLLFFEDSNNLRPNSDFDYNDVVIASTGSLLVPLPAALSSGLLSLGAIGIGGLVRKARRTA